MKKKPPCLGCKKTPVVGKKFYPFCGVECAAKHAVDQFKGDTVYCQEHGWVRWSSTDSNKPPVCLFEHKKKQS